AGAQYKIDGTVITSPADIVQSIGSPILLVLASLSLLLLTVAVNLMANFVAPTYALTNLLLHTMTTRHAETISHTLPLVHISCNVASPLHCHRPPSLPTS